MASTGDPLRDTAAIVTGATSGLGRAVAIRLAAAHAHVALLGRSERDLQQTADELSSEGVRALPLATDLAHTEALAEIVNRIASELGPLSVLVNAAGPMRQDRQRRSLSKTGNGWLR